MVWGWLHSLARRLALSCIIMRSLHHRHRSSWNKACWGRSGRFRRMENVASWLGCLEPGGRGAVLPLPPSTSSTLLLVAAASTHGLLRLLEKGEGGCCALETVWWWRFRESAAPRILTKGAHSVAWWWSRNGGNPYWATEAGRPLVAPAKPPPFPPPRFPSSMSPHPSSKSPQPSSKPPPPPTQPHRTQQPRRPQRCTNPPTSGKCSQRYDINCTKTIADYTHEDRKCDRIASKAIWATLWPRSQNPGVELNYLIVILEKFGKKQHKSTTNRHTLQFI